jgi:hypothetical protein
VSHQEAVELLTQLMDHSCSLMSHIRANVAESRAMENMELLARYRDNITAAMGFMAGMPGEGRP